MNVKKIIPLLYIVCCLAIAFTPNIHKERNIKDNELEFEIPETELEYADDEELEKYEEELENMSSDIPNEHDGITSLIIMKDGKVYSESYYNGNDQSSLFEIHSCTKTVIALCTGIAIDEGFIKSEKVPFIDLFNNLELTHISEGFDKISVENMLTMSSGINWEQYSNSFLVKIKIIKNGLDYGLNVIPSARILFEPGTYFSYDSNESRSLMAMVAFSSGLSDIDFVKKYVFDKLEIYDFMWPYNDSGLLPGSKDLYLCSRDLAKLGQLILDKGSYKGKQVVSEQWIEKMLSPIVFDIPCEDIIPKDNLNYSYFLWNTEYNNHNISFAYGRGGQYIFIVPDMNLCVVTSAIDKVRTDSFREIIYQVIDIFDGGACE